MDEKETFELMEKALDACISRGAEDAEAFLVRSVGTEVKVFEERLENFKRSEFSGLGLRVFIGGRNGRSYITDLSLGAVMDCASIAVESAFFSEPDPHRFIPPSDLYPGRFGGGEALGEELEIWSVDPDGIDIGEKIEFTVELERKAKEYDSAVRKVETSHYTDSGTTVFLLNSRGFRSFYRASEFHAYLTAIAERGGDQQTGFGFTSSRSFSSLEGSGAALEAASNAVALLGARPVDTGRVPIILRSLPACQILAAVSSALSAESVVTGKSYLGDRIGGAVASEAFTLIDDGTLRGGFGSAPFDGEGVRTGSKELISRGVLTGFLHNCYTASRMGAVTSGNASRPSFRSQVGVSPTNIFVSPGSASLSEMMSEMGRGLEVIEIQGAHVGLNPVTGEVSVGAKGRWVEGGKPVRGVREVTIAGKLEEVLKGVTLAGGDFRFIPVLGGIGSPSLLIEGMVVAGW